MPKMKLKPGMKHRGRDKDGNRVDYKGGDEVELTKDQAKAFKDKFVQPGQEVEANEAPQGDGGGGEPSPEEKAKAEAAAKLKEAQDAVTAAQGKVQAAQGDEAKKAAGAELQKAQAALKALQG